MAAWPGISRESQAEALLDRVRGTGPAGGGVRPAPRKHARRSSGHLLHQY